MRTIYILLFFAFLQTANAQDPCSRIKKEPLEDKITFECTTPFDVNEKPPIRATRTYNIDPEFAYDNYYINLRIEGSIDSVYVKNAEGEKVEKDEKGLIIEFDDKSKITDEDVKINHDVSDDHTLAVWYLDFQLSDDGLKSFLSKKVVKFSLASNNMPIPAEMSNALQQYIQCMKNMKKEVKKSQ